VGQEGGLVFFRTAEPGADNSSRDLIQAAINLYCDELFQLWRQRNIRNKNSINSFVIGILAEQQE